MIKNENITSYIIDKLIAKGIKANQVNSLTMLPANKYYNILLLHDGIVVALTEIDASICNSRYHKQHLNIKCKDLIKQVIEHTYEPRKLMIRH